MSDYNMPDRGLFGRRCKIKTGRNAEPFIYRILHSGTLSNTWSEVPLTRETRLRKTVHAGEMKPVIYVVCDTLIDDSSEILCVALKDVELMPEDVRPVTKGKWESGAQDFQTGYTHTCSVCGGFINMYVGGAEDDYNFCPNCGADMREAADDGC